MPLKQIRIDGVIGQGENEISAELIRSQLPENGTDPIRVSFHTEGGSVHEGFAIHDALASYSGPKTAAVESTAFSIGSFILTAFDDVEMSPNAYLMLHNPRIEIEGDDEELAASASVIAKLKSSMVQCYSSKSGKTPEEITAILKAETYMNATEAIANGFANRITEKPIRARAFARLEKMPHGVVTALFGAGSGGNEEPPARKKPMADSQPAAATVTEIKSAFPKAKSDFIVRCMERQLPMASVAQVAAEEMMTENESLAAKVAAMEEELTQARAAIAQATAATAMEGEEEVEEEVVPAATATARRTGVTPVARGTAATPTASVRWNAAIESCLPKCGNNKQKAVAMANRINPGLRTAFLQEVNG